MIPKFLRLIEKLHIELKIKMYFELYNDLGGPIQHKNLARPLMVRQPYSIAV